MRKKWHFDACGAITVVVVVDIFEMGTKTLRKGERAGWTGLSRGIVRI